MKSRTIFGFWILLSNNWLSNSLEKGFWSNISTFSDEKLNHNSFFENLNLEFTLHISNVTPHIYFTIYDRQLKLDKIIFRYATSPLHSQVVKTSLYFAILLKYGQTDWLGSHAALFSTFWWELYTNKSHILGLNQWICLDFSQQLSNSNVKAKFICKPYFGILFIYLVTQK